MQWIVCQWRQRIERWNVYEYIVIQPQETHMELNRTMFNTCVEIESLSLLLGTCQLNHSHISINLTFLWGYDAGFQRVAQSIREDKGSFGFIRGPFKFYVLK